MDTISWSDFERVALRAGTIVEVDDFPQARKPAFKIRVDFGELGLKWSSAQVTAKYSKEALIGKQVIGVVNFPAKRIAGFMSEFLVTGFADEHGDILLATTDGNVLNGSKLH